MFNKTFLGLFNYLGQWTCGDFAICYLIKAQTMRSACYHADFRPIWKTVPQLMVLFPREHFLVYIYLSHLILISFNIFAKWLLMPSFSKYSLNQLYHFINFLSEELINIWHMFITYSYKNNAFKFLKITLWQYKYSALLYIFSIFHYWVKFHIFRHDNWSC